MFPEAYFQGRSTRSVAEMVRARDMRGNSQNPVSRLGRETDAKVRGCLLRPLAGDWSDLGWMRPR